MLPWYQALGCWLH